MNETLTAVSRWTSQAARVFAGISLVAITAIIAWQVFARYVLNASPAWAEQAALLVMIWFVFLAAAAGVRESFHIRIGVVADGLSERPRRFVRVAAQAVVGAFGLALAWWGVELCVEVWRHVIPTLGLSRGWAYVPMPLSGLLMALYALEQILHELRGTEVTPSWN